MSFAEDLTRNRRAYQMLSGDGGAVEEPRVQSSGLVQEEWGQVPEAQYRQNLKNGGLVVPRVEAGETAVQTAWSTSDTQQTPAPEIPKIYRLGDINGGEPVRPAPVVYLETAGQPSAGEDGDLLQTLRRRMEASARRYPQDLDGEEGGTW